MLPYIGNIVLYLFILISLLYITYKVNQGKYYPRLLYKCYFLLFIYLGTYAYFTGDYAHYQHEISRLSTNPLNPTHMEFVYIFSKVGKWRLYVVEIACVCYNVSFVRVSFKVDTHK